MQSREAIPPSSNKNQKKKKKMQYSQEHPLSLGHKSSQ